MTGLEDQEFDFEFLFEFNQRDEGAAAAAPARPCPPWTGSCRPTQARMSFGLRCSPSPTTEPTTRRRAAGGP
ncbi:NFATC1 isoform 8 [Pan troglodytes]|uniref:Nuclear factor of activated T cells 1 n=2 Tax=Homininae TaxID=207598 RepID=K7EQ04_HUMAN|nr:nuclear factor of activated T cells 1 [Homo sapiens]KAI4046812.1 nuclear factor of activated T cells 1 [Homo sapiens]PNI19259.1 NFATC1 isoform 8 [Pan troglodytes]